MQPGRFAIDGNLRDIADLAKIQVLGHGAGGHIERRSIRCDSHKVLVGFGILQVHKVLHHRAGHIRHLGIHQTHGPVLDFQTFGLHGQRLPLRSLSAHLVEHEDETFGRAEVEVNLAILGNLQRITLSGGRIIEPGLTPLGDGRRECDVG